MIDIKTEFLTLQNLLLSLGEELWRAKFLARRMVRRFGEQAYHVLGAFRSAGWSFDDIYQMDQLSNQWRNAPQNILLLERLLLVIGLPGLHARRIAMEYRLYSFPDFGEILLKVHVFRSLGLTDSQLHKMACHKPLLFLTPMSMIEEWQVAMRQRKYEPRFCVQYIKAPGIATKFEPIPIPEYWIKFDLRLGPVSVPFAPPPEPSVLQTGAQLIQKVTDETVEKHTTALPVASELADLAVPDPPEPSPQITPSTSVASSPAPAPTHPIPAPVVRLPPLKAIDPPSAVPPIPVKPSERKPPAVVSADSPIQHDMASELHHLVFDLLALYDQAWLEKNRQAFIDANPWLDDTSSDTWETIRILKGWFDLRLGMSPDDPRLSFVVSILRGQNQQAKKRLGRLRIKRAVLKRQTGNIAELELKSLDEAIAKTQDLLDPSESITAWTERVAKLESWLKRNSGTADGQTTRRTMKKIRRLRGRIAKTKRYGDLRSFLELEPEIAYLRLYMARSILDYDNLRRKSGFLDHPEFLLHPFEDAVYGDDRDLRTFSIPPPAALDMRAIQAKCTELRFRTNELRRYTDQPWKKPYVNMLCEPTRSRFMERLRRHLQKLGDEAVRPSAARHRRRGRTAYSPLG